MTFLFSCLVAVFFAPVVFRDQKIQRYIRILSARTYRSVIPHMRECQRAQLVLNFLEVATLCSPKKQGSIFSSKSQSKAFNLWQTIPFKNCWFYSLHQNLAGPKIPKGSFNFDSCRYSNSCFSVSEGLIPSIEVSVEKFVLVEENSIEKSLWSLHHNPDSPIMPKKC